MSATREWTTDDAIRILLLEPDVLHGYAVADAMAVSQDVYQIVHADDFPAVLGALESGPIDCALLDVTTLGDRLESSLLRMISLAPATSIVLICNAGQEDIAIAGVRHGAHDFVLRDPNHPESLVRTVRSSLERHNSKTNLHFLAHHDNLTGLANRVLFQRTLESTADAAAKCGRLFGLLFLDLDGFKPVNDTLGHDAGDELLRIIARRLRRHVSHEDLVGRLGGDEFAVLIDGLNEARDGVKVASRLLRAIEQPIQIRGQTVRVSGSIGVATNESLHDAQELLKAADHAMYQAKRAGGNGIFVHDEAARTTLLSGALARDELELYYQPQVDLAGRLVGVEALLRWNHDGEIVGPTDFIPELEDSGQIIEVGAWVLEQAVTQLVSWRERGIDVPRVSVNVSPVQLERSDLADTVGTILDRFQLPPSCLELEVTERVMLANDGRARANLEELGSLGVSIALDDFGTGYSSLSCLQEFPIHTIKVDRRFVRDIVSNPRSFSIVGSILDLGRRLGLDVVAEGVETVQQATMLRKEGCQVLQGFLFGRPQSAANAPVVPQVRWAAV
ncbi:MAG: EAL domain-containing protein [Myxococcota bacterium]